MIVSSPSGLRACSTDSRQEVVFGDLTNKSREELQDMIREEMNVLKELEASP